jgi:hypothetical protein
MVTPLPGSIYSSGSAVGLQTDAAVRSGTISEVRFYANGQLIGTANASPFTYSWTNAAPGNYAITAVAASSGRTASSAVIDISVVDYSTRQVQYRDSISMDFGNYMVTSMGPAEIAGVIPRQNWNASYGNSGFLANLVNQQGTTTPAAAGWASPNMYFTGIPDQPGDFRMMKGYQDNTNTVPVQVQVSGIPFSAYDVYIYFDGGNGTSGREANYRLLMASSVKTKVQPGCANQSSAVITGLDAANADFSGTFVQASGGSAGNYVLVPNCTGDTFTLLAVHGGSSDSQYRAPVNGIQIVALPTSK